MNYELVTVLLIEQMADDVLWRCCLL